MYSKISSATTVGVSAYAVDIEVDLSYGMLQFHIVGLPDVAIKESKQRIVTALKNCGIKLPERKITVNLAPADLKKEGTLFDLPIALGILHAAQLLKVPQSFMEETLFLGELSLDGALKGVKGVLPIACDSSKLGKRRLVIPQSNGSEAALIKNLEVIGFTHLTTLISYLRQEQSVEPVPCLNGGVDRKRYDIDFDQVKGQHQGKRALQIAAAGRHNVLFMGSPGSGKTMLAKRLMTIMPPMTFDEMLETSKIYSISGKLVSGSLIVDRPFRNPHHTISQAGLIGGGSFPKPGEVSLAHNGILFLDELAEFNRTTIEVLRQPLESKSVVIARAAYSLAFPASFLLVAASNPCPCGFLGDQRHRCTCSVLMIKKYLNAFSGPFLDRIDLQVSVPSITYDLASSRVGKELTSDDLYSKVEVAVARQRERFQGDNIWNAHMPVHLIDKYCVIDFSAQELIKKAFDRLGLSLRGYHKVLKIARTIADLERSDTIESVHIREALLYRCLDHNLERV
jgi:magnesium chelatase family protein